MINSLKTVINNDIIITIDTTSNKVHLKENASNSKLKGLFITGLPENTICFSLDNKKIPNMCNVISKSAKYVNKAVDGIIITEKKGIFYCLVCELKSNSPNRTDFTNQMKSSKLLIEYLESLIKSFYSVDVRINRFVNVLFSTRSLPKTTISRKKLPLKTYNGISYYEDKCRAGNIHSSFHINKFIDT